VARFGQLNLVLTIGRVPMSLISCSAMRTARTRADHEGRSVGIRVAGNLERELSRLPPLRIGQSPAELGQHRVHKPLDLIERIVRESIYEDLGAQTGAPRS
jgi:hypothetical protein